MSFLNIEGEVLHGAGPAFVVDGGDIVHFDVCIAGRVPSIISNISFLINLS